MALEGTRDIATSWTMNTFVALEAVVRTARGERDDRAGGSDGTGRQWWERRRSRALCSVRESGVSKS